MLFKFLRIQIFWYRIKWVKIVEFVTEFICNSLLGKNFRNETVHSDAAHTPHMHAARERLFVANNKCGSIARCARISYLVDYSVCPEHGLIVPLFFYATFSI